MSHQIELDYPDLVPHLPQRYFAGLLYIPLATGTGQDFILLLRRGREAGLLWPITRRGEESERLRSRQGPITSSRLALPNPPPSSLIWTKEDVQAAIFLAAIFERDLSTSLERSASLPVNALRAILLSNISHNLRTPLSQVINLLELVLLGDIDENVRGLVETCHQSSKSLIPLIITLEAHSPS